MSKTKRSIFVRVRSVKDETEMANSSSAVVIERSALQLSDHATLVTTYRKPQPSQRAYEVLFVIHGTPLDSAVMEDFAIALASESDVCGDCTTSNGRRTQPCNFPPIVVLYDVRGHGFAADAPPPPPFNPTWPYQTNDLAVNNAALTTYASDLQQVVLSVIPLLKARFRLASEIPNVCGWSYGTLIGQRYAQLHPTRSLGLISSLGQGASALQPLADALTNFNAWWNVGPPTPSALTSIAAIPTPNSGPPAFPTVPSSIAVADVSRWFLTEPPSDALSTAQLQALVTVQRASNLTYQVTADVLTLFDLSSLWSSPVSFPSVVLAFSGDGGATPALGLSTVVEPIRAASVVPGLVQYFVLPGGHADLLVQPEKIARYVLNNVRRAACRSTYVLPA